MSKKTQELDSKVMLKELADKKTVIKFNDRIKIEVVKDGLKFLKKGYVFAPHKVVAERYISKGIAKKVK